ncbi:hypothetical protein GA0115260_105432, partial [Streptomyces sp. MnatMP-M27]
LAERCGLPALVGEHVRLPASKDGTGAFPAAKVMSLVGGMAAGADSIDDMDRLRHGAMGRLFSRVRAPSTLGSFLRSFTHGHVNCTPWPAGSCTNWPVTPRCCPARTRPHTWTSTTPSAAPTATPNRALATDTARSRA